MADKRISQLVERVTLANNDVFPIVASGATTTNKVTLQTIDDYMQTNLDFGVTSVAMTVPTGLSVTGTPVTSTGTFVVTFTAGYSIPTNAKQTEWDTAYNLRITSATAPLGIASNVISITQSGASSNGYLSSTDWNTFNNKQNALTFGNLTEDTSSVLTITGGTGSVIGSGTTIQVKQATSSQDGFLDSADWTTFNNKQNALSGTGIVKSTGGTITYLTDNTSNWDSAYNDKINSASVTGTTTKTLTLNQQDGGTITTTWTDLDTGTVTSVGVSMPSAFSVANSPITSSGTIAITGAGTISQYIDGTGALQTFPSIIAQATNLVREVYNNSGATMTKGTVVYINGGQGNLPTIAKALATGDSTSAQTYGVVQNSIGNMSNGYIVVVGDLIDMDTQAFVEGTQLYLSPTTAGEYTSTKQYAPNHLVYVGIVTRSHPTQGIIAVKIQNGYEMDEIHDVSAQNPNNNDILQYKTATGLWTKTAGTTSNIAEGSNLYYTDARARASISESVTGLDYDSATGVLSTTTGYAIPTTASQTNWNTAYNDKINSAAVTGTTTKTLTLTQQDGGTITASWTDDNTDAVSSVFGRTGAVVAVSGDYNTDQVTEGTTNLYFTNARSRSSITLTTTGTSGVATYNSTTGALNIPNYGSALSGYLPLSGGTMTGTINSTSTSDWFAYGSYSSSYLTSPKGAVFINQYPALSTYYFAQIAGNWFSPGSWGIGVRGSADSTIYIGQQSSGVIDTTVNIDVQIGPYKAVKSNRTLTINGTALDLSADRSWTIPTYTLPIATASVLGGVKIGTGIGVDVDGVISVTGVQSQLNGTGFVKANGTTISYDNNTYALDSAVVHITGTETITGAKTFTAAVTKFGNGTGSAMITCDGLDNTSDIGLRIEQAGVLKWFIGMPNNVQNDNFSLLRGGSGDLIYVETNGNTSFTGQVRIWKESYDALLIQPTTASPIANPIGVYVNCYPNADATKIFAQYGGNWASSNNWGMGVKGTNDFTIYISSSSVGIIDTTRTDMELQLGAYKAVKSNRTLTINGTAYDLSADRSWTITAGIGGSGTANYIPKFATSTTLGNSGIIDDTDFINIRRDSTTITNPILQVYPLTGTNASVICMNNAGSGAMYIGRQNSAGNSVLVGSLGAYASVIGHTGTQHLHLVTSGTSQMYVSGDGYGLIIGGATANISNQKLSVGGGMGVSAINLGNMTSIGSLGAGVMYLPITGGIGFRSSNGATGYASINGNDENGIRIDGGSATNTYGTALHLSNGGYGAWVQGSTDGQTHAFIGNFKYNFVTPSSSYSPYTGAGMGIRFYSGIRFISSASGVTGGTFTPVERAVMDNNGDFSTTRQITSTYASQTAFYINSGNNTGGAFFNNAYNLNTSTINIMYGGNWQGAGNWGLGVKGAADTTLYYGQSSSGIIQTGYNATFYVYGFIYATADVTAYSDARVKENIRPIENVLEKIQLSRGVLYDRIDTKTKNNIGFIAQELEMQFPELVHTDLEGKKGVKYANAVAVLFEAVKEQQKQIDDLKKQIV